MIFKKINTDNYELQKVQDSVASSVNDIDKKVRGISNEYDLVMPRYAPASKLPLQMDTEGNVTAEAFTSPTIQKFTSGSGTCTTPTNAKWIRVRMVGGGGGGAGSGTGAGAAAGDGGDTTFGTSLLTAAKGLKGTQPDGGAGGAATINSPAIGTGLSGGRGSGGSNLSSGPGGAGGNNALGGAGGGGAFHSGSGSAGYGAAANTGGGGGGAGANAASGQLAGGGGGAGAFIDAIISAPLLTSYSYVCGAAGAAGLAGASGQPGGAGGAGYVEVTVYY